MSLAKKVTSGVSSLAVAQVAQRLTTLVTTAILARKLLPADFGLIALVLLAVNFIAYFQDMGLSSALVQRETLEDGHLSTSFTMNLGAGFILGALGVLFSPLVATLFREPRLTPLLAVTMLTLPINGCGWVSSALLQRRLSFSRIAIIEWLMVFISGAVAIVLALSGAGVWALVAQNIAGSIVGMSGRLIAAGWLPRLGFNLKRAKELFSFSAGALGYFAVNHLTRNVDRVIIGGALGATALGYYSIAYNLVLLPGMTICGLVGRVMFPALSSVQSDLARFRRAYLRMVRAVSFGALPLVIGLGAIAPLFVTTVYGDKWAPSVPVLQVLIVIGIFEALAVWGAAAWALGKTKMTLGLAIISLVAMTIAFSIGVRWGLLGVAWAYVLVTPVLFVIPHLWTNGLMKLSLASFFKGIAPPLCASVIMGVFVWLLLARQAMPFSSRWASLAGYVAVGAVIYALLLMAMAAVYKKKQGTVGWIIGRHISEIDGQPQGAHS
jgi:O-antigen/teichoic acid export membrane protein